jgi:hypothetical protein
MYPPVKPKPVKQPLPLLDSPKKESKSKPITPHHSYALDATDAEIAEVCNEWGIDEYYHRSLLLHMEVSKQMVTVNDVVSTTYIIINGKRRSESTFFSTHMSKFIELPDTWKIDYLDFTEFLGDLNAI